MASRTADGVDLAKFGLAPAKKERSAASKGSHYKARTKAWLEEQGYQVAHMERMMWIRGGKDVCATCGQVKMFPTKSDQFGADLLAMTLDKLVFVQVKLGDDQVSAARREFAKFTFPPLALRWIVIWELRARAPKVIDCSNDTPATIAHISRGRRLKDTLF